MDIKLINRVSRSLRPVGVLLCGLGILTASAGCNRDLQKRRVELKESSGANPDLEERFGLTSDAQDPSERDKEMGYGKWRPKPEPEGTSSPTDPARRKPF